MKVFCPSSCHLEDLDIYETPEGEYALTYCTATKAYARFFTYDFISPNTYKNKTMQPTALYTLPANAKGQKLKVMRWLSPRPTTVMPVAGMPSRTSASFTALARRSDSAML